jgi:hypothetical protein
MLSFAIKLSLVGVDVCLALKAKTSNINIDLFIKQVFADVNHYFRPVLTIHSVFNRH